MKFVVLPDSPSEFSMTTGVELYNFMQALNNMGPKFDAQLEEVLAESGITCMIRDFSMPCAHKAARKLGIPVAALATMSAAGTHCFFHQETFESHGLIPEPSEKTTESEDLSWMDRFKTFPGPPKDAKEAAELKRTVGDVVPGLAPEMSVADLPPHFLIRKSSPDSEAKRSEQKALLFDCDCLLLNTFHELEVAAIHGMDENAVIFSVGPLVFNPCDSHSHAQNGALLQQVRPSIRTYKRGCALLQGYFCMFPRLI